MAEQTVREQLVEALEEIAKGEGRFNRDHLIHCENTVEDMKALAVAALDRARAEPEESVCTAACDQPSEQHTTSDCPCYEAGANEGHSSGCNDDSCACWEAGHAAGLEAQRERVG